MDDLAASLTLAVNKKEFPRSQWNYIAINRLNLFSDSVKSKEEESLFCLAIGWQYVSYVFSQVHLVTG